MKILCLETFFSDSINCLFGQMFIEVAMKRIQYFKDVNRNHLIFNPYYAEIIYLNSKINNFFEFNLQCYFCNFVRS
jgi:hypothetical protein